MFGCKHARAPDPLSVAQLQVDVSLPDGEGMLRLQRPDVDDPGGRGAPDLIGMAWQGHPNLDRRCCVRLPVPNTVETGFK